MNPIYEYEFLPTKKREREILERGSSSTPSLPYILIGDDEIRRSQGMHLVEQLELQHNIQPQEHNGEDHHHHQQHPLRVWPIMKVLTKSDVGRQCRLVLHRDHVNTFSPYWPPPLFGSISRCELRHPVLLKDVDTQLSEHWLVFRRYQSNKTYVLQSNWSDEFVRRRELRVGDVIGLSWNIGESCIMFSVLNRA